MGMQERKLASAHLPSMYLILSHQVVKGKADSDELRRQQWTCWVAY